MTHNSILLVGGQSSMELTSFCFEIMIMILSHLETRSLLQIALCSKNLLKSIQKYYEQQLIGCSLADIFLRRSPTKKKVTAPPLPLLQLQILIIFLQRMKLTGRYVSKFNNNETFEFDEKWLQLVHLYSNNTALVGRQFVQGNEKDRTLTLLNFKCEGKKIVTATPIADIANVASCIFFYHFYDLCVTLTDGRIVIYATRLNPMTVRLCFQVRRYLKFNPGFGNESDYSYVYLTIDGQIYTSFDRKQMATIPSLPVGSYRRLTITSPILQIYGGHIWSPETEEQAAWSNTQSTRLYERKTNLTISHDLGALVTLDVQGSIALFLWLTSSRISKILLNELPPIVSLEIITSRESHLDICFFTINDQTFILNIEDGPSITLTLSKIATSHLIKCFNIVERIFLREDGIEVSSESQIITQWTWDPEF